MVDSLRDNEIPISKQAIEAIEIIAEETLIKGRNVNLDVLVNNHPPLFSKHVIDDLIKIGLLIEKNKNLHLTVRGLEFFLELQKWKEEKTHNFVMKLYVVIMGIITILGVIFNNSMSFEQKIQLISYGIALLLLFVLVYIGWVEPISKKVKRLRGE